MADKVHFMSNVFVHAVSYTELEDWENNGQLCKLFWHEKDALAFINKNKDNWAGWSYFGGVDVE